MKPTFPFVPKIGQPVFFQTLDPERRTHNLLSYFGTIRGRRGTRWEVNVKNASHNLTFDPVTGIANSFRVDHILCWVGKDYYKGLDYGTAFELARKEIRDAETGVPSKTPNESRIPCKWCHKHCTPQWLSRHQDRCPEAPKPKKVATLSDGDYRMLQEIEIDYPDIAHFFDRMGRYTWTTCPKCHVGNFIHAAGCEFTK